MKRITLLFAALIAITTAFAKSKTESYNIQRANELINEQEMDKALEFLQREIAANPKNANAYDMMGYIYLTQENNGKALSSLDAAIKLYPKKDKKGIARARYYRSCVQLQLKDTVSAITDLEIAHKLQPDDKDYQTELADVYFFARRYQDASRIYTDMVKKDAGDPYPYYGLARNAYNDNRYDEARNYAEKARMLDPTATMPDIIELRIARLEKDYKAVIDHAITVLEKDIYNTEAYLGIILAADSCYTSTVNALIKESFNDKVQKGHWDYLLALSQMKHKDYGQATQTLKTIIEESADMKGIALQSLIECYDELEDLEKVEELANAYLEIYPDDVDVLIQRADAKFFTQRLDKAKEDYLKIADLEPNYAGFCFYRIGWIAEMLGDYEQALADYNKSIALDDQRAYTYMMKGNLLIGYLNRPEEGREALRTCIEKDKIQESGTSLQYAYVGLGERDKAIEVVDSILTMNPDNSGNYYDAACVYSRLKEKDNALKYLRLAFEKGYSKLRHVEADNDLDFIRDCPEYKDLMDEFRPRFEKQPDNVDLQAIAQTEIHEIPLTKQPDGTYIIKASINNLPMDFILDTGCSSVSLSQVESDFMLKNGYISRSDMKGASKYTDANGNVSTNRTVNLATIRIGDLEVKNIRAGVISNQKAPLLLGQQVLNRFGKVEIDTKSNMLRITVIK